MKAPPSSWTAHLSIATFTSGGSTYAAVTAYLDSGVQILNITDPSATSPPRAASPTPAPISTPSS